MSSQYLLLLTRWTNFNSNLVRAYVRRKRVEMALVKNLDIDPTDAWNKIRVAAFKDEVLLAEGFDSEEFASKLTPSDKKDASNGSAPPPQPPAAAPESSVKKIEAPPANGKVVYETATPKAEGVMAQALTGAGVAKTTDDLSAKGRPPAYSKSQWKVMLDDKKIAAIKKYKEELAAAREELKKTARRRRTQDRTPHPRPRLKSLPLTNPTRLLTG